MRSGHPLVENVSWPYRAGRAACRDQNVVARERQRLARRSSSGAPELAALEGEGVAQIGAGTAIGSMRAAASGSPGSADLATAVVNAVQWRSARYRRLRVVVVGHVNTLTRLASC